MSKIATDVIKHIKRLFPHETYKEEHYVSYKGTKLFFDLYIKSLGVLIEIQGRQHFEYVAHFHDTIQNFYNQRTRDNLKIEYCDEQGLTLVYFYDKKDKINDSLILNRIYEALDE
jgi:hypothetical protein